MKELRGQASGTVVAPADRCYALIEAVGRYPDWTKGTVREVSVLSRDEHGRPASARVLMDIRQGRFSKTFELDVTVRYEPLTSVHLTRIPNGPSDEERLELDWRLIPDPESGTTIEIRFKAAVSSLPRFLPAGGLGDVIARSFVRAAARALGEDGA